MTPVEILKAAKAKDVPHLDWRTILDAAEDTPPAIVEALDKYFDPFAARQAGDVCLGCEAELLGPFGRFNWGLVHGEGACSNCGWPARGHHYPKDEDGKDLFAMRNVVLQYHPDAIALAEQERQSGLPNTGEEG